MADEFNVILDCHLEKKSRFGPLKKWKPYRFVLRKNDIRQYTKNDKRVNLFIIQDSNFNAHVVYLKDDEEGQGRVFKVCSKQREILLRAKTPDIARQWVAAIEAQIAGEGVQTVNIGNKEQIYRELAASFETTVKDAKTVVDSSLHAFEVREVGSPAPKLRRRRNVAINPTAEATTSFQKTNAKNSGQSSFSDSKADTHATVMRRREVAQYTAAAVAAVLFVYIAAPGTLTYTTLSLLFVVYWCLKIAIFFAIFLPVYFYVFGNMTIGALLKIPAFQYVAPGLSLHLNIRDQTLVIKHIVLTGKSYGFLGLEALIGLKLSSLQINEISIKLPILSMLSGVEIQIDGIVIELLPLKESEWDSFKDATLAGVSRYSASLANAAVSALEAKLVGLKNPQHGPGIYSGGPSMVDTIIDTLSLSITGIAIRIHPAPEDLATVGIELGGISLSAIAGGSRKREIQLYSFCVVTEIPLAQSTSTSEDSHDSSGEEDTDDISQAHDKDILRDEILIGPINISISLSLPKVMEVLFQVADIPEKKKGTVAVQISNVIIRPSPVRTQVVLDLLDSIGRFGTWQATVIRKYQNDLAELTDYELRLYKDIYSGSKKQNKTNSKDLALLTSLEERMTCEQILLTRWEVEQWNVPNTQNQNIPLSGDEGQNKIIRFRDFVYNRPLTDFDPQNRAEENAKMIDRVHFAFLLEGIELQLFSSTESLEFCFKLSTSTVNADVGMVVRGDAQVQYKAEILVGHLSLTDCRYSCMNSTSPRNLQKPSRVNFFSRIICGCAQEESAAMLEIKYQSLFSGMQDVKVHFHSLSIIVAEPLMQEFLGSLVALTERQVRSPCRDPPVNPTVVDIKDPYPPPTPLPLSGGYLGGLPILCEVTVSGVNVFLLGSSYERTGKGFVLCLDFHAAISSTLSEENIFARMSNLGLKQIEMLPEDKNRRGIIYEFSMAPPILEIEDEISFSVNSSSDEEDKDGNRDIAIVLKDIDAEISFPQMALLNQWLATLSNAEAPENATSMESTCAPPTHTSLAQSHAQKQMIAAFREMDKDNSGTLDLEEFESALKIGFGDQLTTTELGSLARSIFNDIDRTGDGMIDFEEFNQALGRMGNESGFQFNKIASIDLMCSEYAGNGLGYTVFGKTRRDSRLQRLRGSVTGSVKRVSASAKRRIGRLGNRSSPSGSEDSTGESSLVSRRRSSSGANMDETRRSRTESLDRADAEDMFWELMENECNITRTSLNGQSTKTLQLKMIRACKHYEFAKFAWENYVVPSMAASGYPLNISQNAWVPKPSDRSGTISADNIFAYFGELGCNTEKNTKTVESFSMATEITVDFGGIYLRFIDPTLPPCQPALHFGVETIEMKLFVGDESRVMETLNGRFFANIFADYFNGNSNCEEPLIERTPIAISFMPSTGQENSDVIEKTDQCKISIAVSPLKFNASIALMDRIGQCLNIFSAQEDEHNHLCRSTDIGKFGGFYTVNSLGEAASMLIFQLFETGLDDTKQQAPVILESDKPTECMFKASSFMASLHIKEKYLRKVYFNASEEGHGSISDDIAEHILYNASTRNLTSDERLKREIRESVEEADTNESNLLSLSEFLYAAKLLEQKRMMDNEHRIQVLLGSNLSFTLPKLPRVSESIVIRLDDASSVVCHRSEEKALGTVLYVKSTLTLQNTTDVSIQGKLRRGMTESSFTIFPGASYFVPLQFVHRDTLLAVRLNEKCAWDSVRSFPLLFMEEVQLEVEELQKLQAKRDKNEKEVENLEKLKRKHSKDLEELILDTKKLGLETPGFRAICSGQKRKFFNAEAQAYTWTISLLPDLTIVNNLPIAFGYAVEGKSDLLMVDPGGKSHLYNLLEYSGQPKQSDVIKPSGENRTVREIALRIGQKIKDINIVLVNLESRASFLMEADFEDKKKRYYEAKITVGFQSISITRTWGKNSSPTITFNASLAFKNLTGMKLHMKLRTSLDKEGHTNANLEDDPVLISHPRSSEPAFDCLLSVQLHGRQDTNLKPSVDAAQQFGKYTNEVNAIWPGYYLPLSCSGKATPQLHSDKYGMFNVFTNPSLDPLAPPVTRVVTIHPIYEVKNLMPFPVEVFAGKSVVGGMAREGIMTLRPGEQGAIYRFYNLKEKDFAQIVIRPLQNNTLRHKYPHEFKARNSLSIHEAIFDKQRWSKPLAFTHNENLIGTSTYAFVDNADPDANVDADLYSNDIERSPYVVCRADVVFTANNGNYGTKFMTLSPSPAPYRIENRSSSQFLSYYEKSIDEIITLRPKHSCDFVFCHSSCSDDSNDQHLHVCHSDEPEFTSQKFHKIYVNRVNDRKTIISVSPSKFQCVVDIVADGVCRVLTLFDGDSETVAFADNDGSELLLSKNMDVTIQLGAIMISVTDETDKEIVEISFNDIDLQLNHNSWKLSVLHIQCDDLRSDTEHPVVLEPHSSGFNTCRRIGDEYNRGKLIPVLNVSYTYFSRSLSSSTSSMVKGGNINIEDLSLTLDLTYIMTRVLDVYWRLYPPSVSPLQDAVEGIHNAFLPLVPLVPTRDERTYFEKFTMNSFKLHAFIPMQSDEDKKKTGTHGLSVFLGDTLGGIINMIAGDLDQTFHVLRYERRLDFIVSGDLMWNVIYKIIHDIELQLGMTFLKLEAFGDVGSQLEGLYQGLKDGGRNALKGNFLAAGSSIAQGSVGGAFATVGHVTNFAGNFVKKVTGTVNNEDDEEPKHLLGGLFQGGKVFGKSLTDGIAGVFKQPVKGWADAKIANKGKGTGQRYWQQSKGMAKGVARGISGLVAAPVVGVLGLVEKTSVGATNSTRLSDRLHLVGTRRPARISHKVDKRTNQTMVLAAKPLMEDPNIISGVCFKIRNVRIKPDFVKMKEGKAKFFVRLEVFDSETKANIFSERTHSVICHADQSGLTFDTPMIIDVSRRKGIGRGMQKTVECVSCPHVYFVFTICRVRGVTKKEPAIVARRVLENEDISEMFHCVDRSPFSDSAKYGTSVASRCTAWDIVDAKASLLYGADTEEEGGGWLTMSGKDVDSQEFLDVSYEEAVKEPTHFTNKSVGDHSKHELNIQGQYWRYRDHNMSVSFLHA